MEAIDCATRLTTRSAADLKGAGIVAVGRYLGFKSRVWSKTLTPVELAAIHLAGLSVFLIWESDPTSVGYFSYARGVFDARAAVDEASFLGAPPTTAIYFTVDYDAQTGDIPVIIEYFQGVHDGIKGQYLVGAYGSHSVLTALAQSPSPPDRYYQTYAWSQGQIFDKNHVYQYQNSITLCGIEVDKDLLNDFSGAWPDLPDTIVPVKQYLRVDKPTLAIGDSGDQVKDLQVRLQSMGYYNGLIDGEFGPITQAGVIHFQGEHVLVPDGIVGPLTWSKILPVISEGTISNDVMLLQRAIVVTVDGDFGPITRGAVEEFQRSHDLFVDGIVGPLTWAKLLQLN